MREQYYAMKRKARLNRRQARRLAMLYTRNAEWRRNAFGPVKASRLNNAESWNRRVAWNLAHLAENLFCLDSLRS